MYITAMTTQDNMDFINTNLSLPDFIKYNINYGPDNFNIQNLTDLLSANPFYLNIKHDKTEDLFLLKLSPKSDINNLLVSQCDGTMLNAEMQVVCYSGQVKPNYLSNDLPKDLFKTHISTYKFVELLDGTCIRVFYHNNKWVVSTKGHTNAMESKWQSSKSFGELFNECIQLDYSKLNQNNTYVFILRHTENNPIDKVVDNCVYHIATYNTHMLLSDQSTESLSLLPKSYQFNTLKEFFESFKKMKSTSKGYLMTYLNKNMCIINNYRYEYLKMLKGNNLNMEHQYLYLYSINEHLNLIRHFPEYTYVQTKLEPLINARVAEIFNLYREKFIKKNPEKQTMSPVDWKYVYAVHSHYLETQTNITFATVKTVMFKKNCLFIYENI
jgi:hypothetical protein